MHMLHPMMADTLEETRVARILAGTSAGAESNDQRIIAAADRWAVLQDQLNELLWRRHDLFEGPLAEFKSITMDPRGAGAGEWDRVVPGEKALLAQLRRFEPLYIAAGAAAIQDRVIALGDDQDEARAILLEGPAPTGPAAAAAIVRMCLRELAENCDSVDAEDKAEIVNRATAMIDIILSTAIGAD
jgi:hypothetical protein